MTGKEHEEPLEAMFSADDPYIDDAGFTARVMERLPPRRKPATAFAARTAILLGASAVAALVMLLNHPLCVELDRAFSAMLARPCVLVTGAAPLTSVVLLVMLLFAGVTAVQRE